MRLTWQATGLEGSYMAMVQASPENLSDWRQSLLPRSQLLMGPHDWHSGRR